MFSLIFFLLSSTFQCKNLFDPLRKAEISFSTENIHCSEFIVLSAKGVLYSINYVTNRFIALKTTDFINRIEKLLFSFDFPKFYHKSQHRTNVCSRKKLRYRFSTSALQHVCELRRVVQISIALLQILCVHVSRPPPKSGSNFLIVVAWMEIGAVFEKHQEVCLSDFNYFCISDKLDFYCTKNLIEFVF